MADCFNDVCSICLDPLRQAIFSTPCVHYFHRECLLDWFKNGIPGNCCPMCKMEMRWSEAIPVLNIFATSSSSPESPLPNQQSSAATADTMPGLDMHGHNSGPEVDSHRPGQRPRRQQAGASSQRPAPRASSRGRRGGRGRGASRSSAAQAQLSGGGMQYNTRNATRLREEALEQARHAYEQSQEAWRRAQDAWRDAQAAWENSQNSWRFAEQAWRDAQNFYG